MAGWAAKFIAIWLMVDIVLLIYGFNVGPGLETNYVQIEGNAWNGSIEYSNVTSPEDLGLGTQVNASGNSTVTTGTPSFFFINGLSYVWNGIKFVLRFIFKPIDYLHAVGAPLPIVLVLGVIPSILFIISIIAFIRGSEL